MALGTHGRGHRSILAPVKSTLVPELARDDGVLIGRRSDSAIRIFGVPVTSLRRDNLAPPPRGVRVGPALSIATGSQRPFETKRVGKSVGRSLGQAFGHDR